jgi:hypothetical protein
LSASQWSCRACAPPYLGCPNDDFAKPSNGGGHHRLDAQQGVLDVRLSPPRSPGPLDDHDPRPASAAVLCQPNKRPIHW